MKHIKSLNWLMFLLTCSIINFSALFAQQPVGTSGSYAKFSNEPVGLFTGTPNVSIPIGELSGRKLSVPIYLSYHSSGIKVDELASWVGLGWNLQAGGVITRSIRSNPDKINNYNVPDINNVTTSYLGSVVSGNGSSDADYDSEPDIFYFNINGRSGSFVLDTDTDSNGGIIRVARCIPYEDLKILYTPTTDGEHFDSWEIITEDGIRYVFGGTGYNEYKEYESEPNLNLSWYLKEIITPNNEDVISFNYATEILKYDLTPTYTNTYIKVKEDCKFEEYYPEGCNENTPSDCESFCYHYYQFSDVYPNTETIYTCRLQSIESSFGKVVFQPQDSPRQDVRHDIEDDALFNHGIINSTSLPYALKEIKFMDKVGYAYKHFLLNTTYYNYRLWLNSVTESTADYTQLLPPYQFYYDSIPLPSSTSLHKDYYGYYNGLRPNKTKKILDHWTENVYDRTINSDFAKAGILEKVVLPDGGRIEYTYEGNNYIDPNGNIIRRGGLRVNKVETFESENSNSLTTEYNYVNQYNLGHGFHILQYLNVDYDRDLQYIHDYNGVTQNDTMIVVNIGGTTQFSNLVGAEDGYETVTVSKTYAENGITKSNGKVVYEYANGEIYPDDVSPAPKTLPYVDHSYNFSFQQPTSMSWRRGLLKSTTVYDAENILLKKEVYTYDDSDLIPLFFKEIKALQIEKFCDKVFESGKSDDEFGYSSYSIKTGRTNMTSKTVTNYDTLANAIPETTEYFYSNVNYNQIDSIKNTDSKGIELVTKIYYPNKCKSYDLSNEIKSDLIQKNIISPVIKKESFKNGEIIAGQKTKLAYFNTNTSAILMPSTSLAYELDTFKEKTFIDNYDEYGHILQYHGEDGILSSTIYGYNKHFPIANVINAGYDQIFVEDFENENGNSNISRTGKKGHTEDYVVHFPDINGDYTLTYWEWINDAWQLKESSENVTSAGYTKAITGTIDDVRVHPKDAYMVTYTYDPVFGKTSETNANYRTVYYEYDNLGRLLITKDHDRNIISKSEYNYKPFSFISNNQLFFDAQNASTQTIIASENFDTDYNVVDKNGNAISWVTININNNKLNITCSDNNNATSRIAYIRINYGSDTANIEVTQEPYLVSEYYINIPVACNKEDIGRFEDFDFFFNIVQTGTYDPGHTIEVHIDEISCTNLVGYYNQLENCETNYKCTFNSGDIGIKYITVKVLENGIVKKEESHQIIVYPNN